MLIPRLPHTLPRSISRSGSPPLQICIRGPGVFTAYYKNEAMSKECIGTGGAGEAGGCIDAGGQGCVPWYKNEAMSKECIGADRVKGGRGEGRGHALLRGPAD